MPKYFVIKLSLLGIISSVLFTVCVMSQDKSSQENQNEQIAGRKTNVKKRSIELSEIISGGVPQDGISALDAPKFVSINEAGKWLKTNEPVISLEIGREVRAYPLQILIWHEIVNDSFLARYRIRIRLENFIDFDRNDLFHRAQAFIGLSFEEKGFLVDIVVTDIRIASVIPVVARFPRKNFAFGKSLRKLRETDDLGGKLI